MSGPMSLLTFRGGTMCRALRSVAVCTSLAVFACTLASGGSAQGLTSADLSRFRSVGSVALSPDGHRVAYTVVMRDRPGRAYGQLWLMDLATQKSSRVGGDKTLAAAPYGRPTA